MYIIKILVFIIIREFFRFFVKNKILTKTWQTVISVNVFFFNNFYIYLLHNVRNVVVWCKFVNFMELNKIIEWQNAPVRAIHNHVSTKIYKNKITKLYWGEDLYVIFFFILRTSSKQNHLVIFFKLLVIVFFLIFTFIIIIIISSFCSDQRYL